MLNIDFQALRVEVESAPHGMKRAVVESAARSVNVSPDTIYRELRKRFGRQKTLQRECLIDDALIDKIADLKLKGMAMSLEDREVSTELCIDMLRESGVPGADSLTVSSVNRRLRKKGFRMRDPKIRYESFFANHEAQMDFSRSKYFQLWKHDDKAGKYVLKVANRELHYKKDGNRFRLWLAMYVDTFSRLRISRAFPATGESAMMGIEFLGFVWQRDEDDHPLRYLPVNFKTDNGAFEKRAEVRAMLDALGINRRRSRPGNKDSQQKVETQWKVLWRRFELPLAIRLAERGIKTIYLSEYNDLLHEHLTAEQFARHPLKADQRGRIYRQSILKYPPRSIDIDLKDIACRVEYRVVGQDLMIKYQNEQFEAPVYAIDKRIRIYRNMAGELMGELIEEDRKPFILKPYRVRAFDDFEHRPHSTYRQNREQILKDEKRAKAEAQKTIAAKKETFLKPDVKQAKVDSPFVRTDATEFPNIFAAKVYIGNSLPKGKTYADYEFVFGDLLRQSLSKSEIDAVLTVINNQKLMG